MRVCVCVCVRVRVCVYVCERERVVAKLLYKHPTTVSCLTKTTEIHCR